MAGTRKRSQPTFLWQAGLILLPVVVLAAVGALSLRQDRLLARHEATARAQAIADDLVRRVWVEVVEGPKPNPDEGHAFRTDTDGQLIFPPPMAPVPIPKPFDVAALSEEQARLWHEAQRLERDNWDAASQ